MSTQSPRMILVATVEGLYHVNGGGAARVDELAGREVRALATGGGWWAIVEGRELWRGAEGERWSLAATVPRWKATCLAATPAGLLVGTARAHLLRLERERLEVDSSFDAAEGREAWHTPWGAPADVRSISSGADGAVYVNVHVGGVLRSTDGGAGGWRPTLEIEHDVHQVLAVVERPGLVLVAAADGFGLSPDGGDTWRWDNGGLHAHYCRAVALAGDTVRLSASTGHRGRRATLYRRLLDGGGGFERCQAGLPEWFADNLDTGCLAARGRTVVIGTEDGCVFLSGDAGERWDAIAKGLAPVRAVALG